MGKYDFSDKKPNLSISLRNASKDGSAVLVFITWEQVSREQVVVTLGDNEDPRFGRA